MKYKAVVEFSLYIALIVSVVANFFYANINVGRFSSSAQHSLWMMAQTQAVISTLLLLSLLLVFYVRVYVE